jgi:ABC-2 type transport system permease protein
MSKGNIMKKLFNIAWKDIQITLSDPAALILTIVTPFALTLVMIFAFGGSDDSGIRGIPVAIVNLDKSELGLKMVEVFQSEDLASLVAPALVDDPEVARAGVDSDEYAAAVIIPANFGEGLNPSELTISSEQEQAIIEIYANPTRPTSVSVVRTIVDEFINQASAMVFGIQVSIGQMLKAGILDPTNPTALMEIGEFGAKQNETNRLIKLQGSMAEGSVNTEFDWFSYIAPSLALLFLMFTITNGGRSILAEREGGTLPRMLVTPSNASQVLGGKVFGIYLNGVLQLAVLFVASLVLLQINWGPANVVIPTILFVVAAATGWGMLIAAFAKTPAQANIMGTAITLVFAIGSGSFFPRELLPQWLQTISLISPNAWGIEAFNSIRLGATAVELLPLWGGMLAMFVVLFIVSTFTFRRQYS